MAAPVGDLRGATLWRPLERLRGVVLAADGADERSFAKALGRSPGTIRAWLEGFRAGGLRGLLGEPTGSDQAERHLQIFSNLLVAQLGEEIFMPLMGEPLIGMGYQVVDRRTAHAEQDFDIRDDVGRSALSVNVKVHSSRFRNAPQVVALAADDCFALALYKILSAFKQMRETRVPFLFLVSMRWGIVEEVVRRVPADLGEMVELVFRARARPWTASWTASTPGVQLSASGSSGEPSADGAGSPPRSTCTSRSARRWSPSSVPSRTWSERGWSGSVASWMPG